MLLSSKVLEAASRCTEGFKEVAIHEYTTANAKTTLAKAISAQENLGYEVVHVVSGVTAYMQKGDGERIRVVHSGVKPHDAWAVSDLQDYRKLRGKFISDPEFEFSRTKSDKKTGDRYTSFIHKPTDYHVRVVLRKTPIFKGTFGKPYP
ncbi:MAG: hypothetical protein K9M11_00910 [Candidatus Pacebacteria bacterium]|nr:hypothetical protein [Candidatus Paceibacterota bacterium]